MANIFLIVVTFPSYSLHCELIKKAFAVTGPQWFSPALHHFHFSPPPVSSQSKLYRMFLSLKFLPFFHPFPFSLLLILLLPFFTLNHSPSCTENQKALQFLFHRAEYPCCLLLPACVVCFAASAHKTSTFMCATLSESSVRVCFREHSNREERQAC